MEKKEVIINDSKTEGTIPWWVVVAIFYCFSKVLCSIFRDDNKDDELKKVNKNLEDIKDNLDEIKYDVSRMRDTVDDINSNVEDIKDSIED